jgi:hypothetical protein
MRSRALQCVHHRHGPRTTAWMLVRASLKRRQRDGMAACGASSNTCQRRRKPAFIRRRVVLSGELGARRHRPACGVKTGI